MRALRIAALVKQIPVFEEMRLGPDGRLQRDGLPLEMSAYCRRAVAQGVALARETGGRWTIITPGPPPPEGGLRGALPGGGGDGGVRPQPPLPGPHTPPPPRALAPPPRPPEG